MTISKLFSKKYYILQTIIFVCILGILGYMLGKYIGKSSKTIYEGARTLPRPTRHPLNLNDWLIPISSSYSGQTMNQFVDMLINQYFDNNGIPYQNTATIYTNYVLGGPNGTGIGNVAPATKSKMTDIGYYILNIVMPNIPTENNPTPTVSWPAIKWTNNSSFPLNIPDTSYMTYSNSWNTYQWQLNGQDVSSTYINLNGSSTPGNSTPGNSTLGGSSTPGGCYNPNNTCGNICPNSCFANAIASSSTFGNSTNGNNGDNGDNGNNGDNGSDGGEWTQVATSHTSTVTIGNTTFQYYITDASQNAPPLPAIQPLDVSLNAIIDWYFDKTTGYPTNQAIAQFEEYTSGREPMDLFHKNKLRDVVYYFMENIIPGLPPAQVTTSTSLTPVTYVEWKPIVWLSHSDI